MAALQRHNTENSKQIFPEKKLCGHSPNSAYSAAGEYVDRFREYLQ
jgi:hypothetical protein